MRKELTLLISQLKRLTPKERYYILNFFVNNKTGNRNMDLRNFEFDLTLQHFRNSNRMLRIFDMMYGLNDEEISKLARTFKR